jgi:hypothetical protein
MVLLLLIAAGCDAFLHGVPDKLPPRGGIDDGQPPVITFESPVDDAVVQGTITWTVSVEDAVSGIASVELQIDGARADTLFTAPYTIAWDTTTHADGAAILEVIATDASARANKATKRITVRVDNDPPAKPTPTVVAERHHEIEIEWPSVVDAARYVVRYGTVEARTEAPSITLDRLLACERYAIVVSALDGAPTPNRADSDPIDARTRCGGDGTFTVTQTIDRAVGQNPAAVALADFDGDRILDVAIAQARTVTIYYGEGTDGRGAGAFASLAPYAIAIVDLAEAIEVGDFNQDGIADLAVTANAGPATEGRGRVVVLLGTGANGRGDGRFAPAVVYPTGSGSRDLVSADFDRDHILDLAVTNMLSGTVTILFGGGSNGRGDGTFARSATYATSEMPGAGSPDGIAAADFNADGVIDLAAANPEVLGILIGNGDGSFRLNPDIPSPGDNSGRHVLSGDLNADGIIDLISTSRGAVSLPEGQRDLVFLGNGSKGRGDGTFREWSEVQVVSGVASLADVNHDGILDVIDSFLAVELGVGSNGRGTGTFAPPVDIGSGLADLNDVAVVDLNGDRIVDLVGADEQTGAVHVALGNGRAGRGDGTFALGTPAVPAASWDGVSRDFDTDGVLDLATIGDRDGLAIAFGIGIDGRGSGRFESPITIPFGIQDPVALVAADVDRDSAVDLAVEVGVRGEMVGEVRIVHGAADGTFQAMSSLELLDTRGSLAIVDTNADAIPDLLAADAPDVGVGPVLLAVFLGGGTGGRGDGTFARTSSLALGFAGVSIATGDFEANGIADAAVVGGTQLAIALGNGSNGRGDGTFRIGFEYVAGEAVFDLVASDFNLDGISDLALTTAPGVEVLTGNGTSGRGDGTFSFVATYPLPEPGRIRSVDVDADGIRDLVQLTKVPRGVEQQVFVAVLIGNGDGTFRDPALYETGTISLSMATRLPLVVEDFDSDGIIDLFADGNLLFGQGTFGP